LRAVEQKRPDVALARRIWIGQHQPFMRNMLTRLAFIDETSLKTNMAKTTGWAERGARLVDHAPFGHSLPGNGLLANRERGNTQTFIAALRHDRLDALWVIGGAMNREFFDLYVETQLAPTLSPACRVWPMPLSGPRCRSPRPWCWTAAMQEPCDCTIP
jgi:hypothetical protein